MPKREDPMKKLVTQGILRAMDRLQSGNWFEVANDNVLPNWSPLKASGDSFRRQLRLCVKYGWMEDGPAVSTNAMAFRMTPQGFAIYDRYKLLEGAIAERAD